MSEARRRKTTGGRDSYADALAALTEPERAATLQAHGIIDRFLVATYEGRPPHNPIDRVIGMYAPLLDERNPPAPAAIRRFAATLLAAEKLPATEVMPVIHPEWLMPQDAFLAEDALSASPGVVTLLFDTDARH